MRDLKNTVDIECRCAEENVPVFVTEMDMVGCYGHQLL